MSYYVQLNLLDRFSKNTEVSIFMKVHLLGAAFLPADGQTDTGMKSVMVSFGNFKTRLKIRIGVSLASSNDCSLLYSELQFYLSFLQLWHLVSHIDRQSWKVNNSEHNTITKWLSTHLSAGYTYTKIANTRNSKGDKMERIQKV